MSLLSEGGGAVDAVEMAIMVLEGQEITNAGYGSNLSLDGTVECDATLVDHYGRSGAVGAVARKWPNESTSRILDVTMICRDPAPHPSCSPHPGLLYETSISASRPS